MSNYDMTLFFESFCIVKDTIWMSARDFNGIFKGNLKDGSMDFIGCFPGENALKKRLHYGEAIYKDKKIYFTPLESGHIHVFDLRSSSFVDCGEDRFSPFGYSKSLLFEDSIFMISTRVMDILRYDIRNHIYEIVYKSESGEKHGYAHGIYTFGADLYMVLSKNNVLRRFNMKDYQVEDYLVGESARKYQIVGGRENIIYFMDEDNSEVISWDIFLNREWQRNTMKFDIKLNAWQLDRKILGNATLGEGITLLDIEQLTTSKMFVNKEKALKNSNMLEIQNAFLYNQDLYFVWQGDGTVYSLKTGKKKMHFLLTDDILQNIRTEIVQNMTDDVKNVIKEQDIFRLQELIRYLENRSS